MNERTRELANQAGLKVESWMTNPPKPFQILGSTEQFEKFAELIVRECIGVAEVSMPVNSYPDDRLAVKNNVLKHFGVEE